MGNMSRRVTLLETADPPGLSARARQWLGWPLSETDLAELEREEPSAIDIGSLSPEERSWLGLD